MTGPPHRAGYGHHFQRVAGPSAALPCLRGSYAVRIHFNASLDKTIPDERPARIEAYVSWKRHIVACYAIPS